MNMPNLPKKEKDAEPHTASTNLRAWQKTIIWLWTIVRPLCLSLTSELTMKKFIIWFFAILFIGVLAMRNDGDSHVGALLSGFLLTILLISACVNSIKTLFMSFTKEEKNQSDVALNRKLSEESVNKKVNDLILQHIDTLVKKRMHLVQVNDYGIYERKPFLIEIGFFLTKVVAPQLSPNEKVYLAQNTGMYIELIESTVTEHIKAHPEKGGQ